MYIISYIRIGSVFKQKKDNFSLTVPCSEMQRSIAKLMKKNEYSKSYKIDSSFRESYTGQYTDIILCIENITLE